MAAQPSQPHYISVDDWRELEERSHDVKHEYIDGQVYAMADRDYHTASHDKTKPGNPSIGLSGFVFAKETN